MWQSTRAILLNGNQRYTRKLYARRAITFRPLKNRPKWHSCLMHPVWRSGATELSTLSGNRIDKQKRSKRGCNRDCEYKVVKK